MHNMTAALYNGAQLKSEKIVFKESNPAVEATEVKDSGCNQTLLKQRASAPRPCGAVTSEC